WDGDLALDGTYAMSSLALTASLQEPPYRVHMKFDPAQKTVAYELMMGARTVKTATIPMNQEGVSTLVREQLGIDPGIVLQNLPASTTHPTITAKQTELTIRKETVAAYLLTIKTGETTVAEIYVSQLGQVLAAKTLFGYDFAAEDTTPP
ncbi:MAG TPA: hypothetical protein VG733_02825, partial [Chthoniobacteraceae bacterium]|nr:hypothetical protein [Chthoniobacteraceae bacterium]